MRIRPGDPHRVATILPGQGYHPDMPLLHYARLLLVSRGWTVQEVWWDEVPDADRVSVSDVVRRVLADDEGVRSRLLVGKSLGSMALPLAVEENLPGIWLTPLLTRPEIAAAAQALTAPSLLVGGTADEYWGEGPQASRPAVQVLEVAGADHSLELPDDAPGSARVLVSVMDAMAGLVDRIPG